MYRKLEIECKELIKLYMSNPMEGQAKDDFLLFGRAESSEDDQTAEKPNK